MIVIAHHQAVMARADWIIDLGPGAGHEGGRIVFEGTPAALVRGRATLTGEHLAAYVGGAEPAPEARTAASRRAPATKRPPAKGAATKPSSTKKRAPAKPAG